MKTIMFCLILIFPVTAALSGKAAATETEKLVEVCSSCHGRSGASSESDVPIIGGYSAEFVKERLNTYKSGDTACPETKIRAGKNKGQKTDMCKIVHDLNPAEIKQIAQYFSQQKFVRAKQQKFDSTLAKKGKEIHEENCEKCHSEGGTVASDDAGFTGGQWMPYIENALQEFASGKRPIAKKMKIKLDKMEKADLEALVNYYGSIK
jgi:sulfide dehydrogenase cytochrome subunit